MPDPTKGINKSEKAELEELGKKIDLINSGRYDLIQTLPAMVQKQIEVECQKAESRAYTGFQVFGRILSLDLKGYKKYLKAKDNGKPQQKDLGHVSPEGKGPEGSVVQPERVSGAGQINERNMGTAPKTENKKAEQPKARLENTPADKPEKGKETLEATGISEELRDKLLVLSSEQKTALDDFFREHPDNQTATQEIKNETGDTVTETVSRADWEKFRHPESRPQAKENKSPAAKPAEAPKTREEAARQVKAEAEKIADGGKKEEEPKKEKAVQTAKPAERLETKPEKSTVPASAYVVPRYSAPIGFWARFKERIDGWFVKSKIRSNEKLVRKFGAQSKEIKIRVDKIAGDIAIMEQRVEQKSQSMSLRGKLDKLRLDQQKWISELNYRNNKAAIYHNKMLTLAKNAGDKIDERLRPIERSIMAAKHNLEEWSKQIADTERGCQIMESNMQRLKNELSNPLLRGRAGKVARQALELQLVGIQRNLEVLKMHIRTARKQKDGVDERIAVLDRKALPWRNKKQEYVLVADRRPSLNWMPIPPDMKIGETNPIKTNERKEVEKLPKSPAPASPEKKKEESIEVKTKKPEDTIKLSLEQYITDWNRVMSGDVTIDPQEFKYYPAPSGEKWDDPKKERTLSELSAAVKFYLDQAYPGFFNKGRRKDLFRMLDTVNDLVRGREAGRNKKG